MLGRPRLTGIPELPAGPAGKTTEKRAAKVQGHRLTPVRAAPSKRLQTVNAREGVEKRELSSTVGRIVNWYSHHGEQGRGSSKN